MIGNARSAVPGGVPGVKSERVKTALILSTPIP